ncbi:hypothetical protein HER10_EVM0002560 [Colletotrichum scovillei]|uniref:uncharacterized protein n=1 Tax=Colletotrichum scovillei TaxID=1209932 RepID=UPI0015C2D51A|nr:uncharacterized protein HER10_EVM0002560 [Colletotrichum scovillei]KAF4778282.1 hypothetical protein HER10_EVM0002560 [Colletotrichum scovillei]
MTEADGESGRAREKEIEKENAEHNAHVKWLLEQCVTLTREKNEAKEELQRSKAEVTSLTSENARLSREIDDTKAQTSAEVAAMRDEHAKTLKRLMDAMCIEGSGEGDEPLSLKRAMAKTPKLFPHEADKQWIATAMTVCARLISLNVIDERMAYEDVIEELAGVVADDDAYQKIVGFLEKAEYKENYCLWQVLNVDARDVDILWDGNKCSLHRDTETACLRVRVVVRNEEDHLVVAKRRRAE